MIFMVPEDRSEMRFAQINCFICVLASLKVIISMGCIFVIFKNHYYHYNTTSCISGAIEFHEISTSALSSSSWSLLLLLIIIIIIFIIVIINHHYCYYSHLPGAASGVQSSSMEYQRPPSCNPALFIEILYASYILINPSKFE